MARKPFGEVTVTDWLVTADVIEKTGLAFWTSGAPEFPDCEERPHGHREDTQLAVSILPESHQLGMLNGTRCGIDSRADCFGF